ncbi:MAG TPA: hypothetical protein VGW78_05210 [Candidatus Babeliales bacterium]|jgi:hypothetical protein|nr:hypothetical protein [Candidatus Babeliales bacterium]
MKRYISLSIICTAASMYSMDPYKLQQASKQLKYAPTVLELYRMYCPLTNSNTDTTAPNNIDKVACHPSINLHEMHDKHEKTLTQYPMHNQTQKTENIATHWTIYEQKNNNK